MKRTISVAILIGSLAFLSANCGPLEERPDIKECLDEVELKLKEIEIPEEAKLAAKLLFERNPSFMGQNLFSVVNGYLEEKYGLNGELGELDWATIEVCQEFRDKVFEVLKNIKCGFPLMEEMEEIRKIDRDIIARDYPTWTDIFAHLTICPFSKQ